MRISAGSLCVLSLLALLARPVPAAAQQRQRQPPPSQACCRIEGQVVGPDGGPVNGLRIVIKRDKTPLVEDLSDKSGRYAIRFENGGTINVKYGDEDRWEPAVVENISGRTNHRITKVLVLRHAGRLTRDQAGEVVSALEFMSNHWDDFADGLSKYTATLNKDEFPPEFHERLSRIEQAVAARHKEQPPLPPGKLAPSGLVRPISLDETAAVSPLHGGLRLGPPRLEYFSSFRLAELHLPTESPQLRYPEAAGVQSTPDVLAREYFGTRRPRAGDSMHVVRGGYGLMYLRPQQLDRFYDSSLPFQLETEAFNIPNDYVPLYLWGEGAGAVFVNQPHYWPYSFLRRNANLDPRYACVPPPSPRYASSYRLGFRIEF